MSSIERMLIIGGFSKGAIENFYKRGFERCGVQVDSYGSADEFYNALAKSNINKALNKISPSVLYNGINKRLLVFIARKKYDVILVFKGMELYEETVEQLKGYTRLLINYNCDHPFIFYFPGSGNGNVKNSIKQYDIHFSYSKNIVAQLKEQFNKTAYYIPFGYDNHAEVNSMTGDNIYTSRVLFIGAYDTQRATFLNDLNLQDVDIYGDTKWKTRNFSKPFIVQAYKQRSLYGADYINAVSHSMGIINILREQNILENSHNMRTFEAPGYGGLLISKRTTEQLEFFEEDKEAIFYDTIEELKEKIIFLRKHPQIVEDIKKAGFEKSRRCKYDYDERSRQLLQCLVTHLD